MRYLNRSVVMLFVCFWATISVFFQSWVTDSVRMIDSNVTSISTNMSSIIRIQDRIIDSSIETDSVIDSSIETDSVIDTSIDKSTIIANEIVSNVDSTIDNSTTIATENDSDEDGTIDDSSIDNSTTISTEINNIEDSIIDSSIDSSTFHMQQAQPQQPSNTSAMSYNGVVDLIHMGGPWFEGRYNAFCSAINDLREKENDPNRFIIVNFTFGCQDVFVNGIVGTGNYIALLYGVRLSAHVLGNIDLYMTCDDAEFTKRELILPWILGYFPARLAHQESKYAVSNESACGTMHTLPLAYMHKEIQHELRRMAIALVGIPSQPGELSPHASKLFAQQYLWPSPQEQHPIDYTSSQYTDNSSSKSVLLLPPSLPNDEPLYTSSQFEVDDVALHFRCGDFMSDVWGEIIETSTFQCYVRHIPNNVSSIGILTQPFEFQGSTQQRPEDSDQMIMNRCKILVHSLIAYIQHHHPNVQIRVHNSMNETITLAYARMIMAHQSITGMTSFGEFAIAATFGTGYIRSPSQWMKQIDLLTDQVILYQPDKVVPFRHIKQLWNENGTVAALEWFWNGAIPIDRNYCGNSSDICHDE